MQIVLFKHVHLLNKNESENMTTRKSNQEPESIESILKSLSIPAPWIETRGPKMKYFFHHLKPGQVEKKEVAKKKARTIQVSMKQAANRQGFDVSIQNHGDYLLIRRNK